jgi:heme ABC exporter ATP-binding subunit CcmA
MLEVKNMAFSFESHPPLFKDLSFNLPQGQILRLAGGNGKGKSTLLKCLLGLLQSDQGSVILNGNEDLGYFKENVEYLPAESNAHFEDLSAIENIKMWVQLKSGNFNHEDAVESLNKWGFTGNYLIEQLPVSKFSTGMKRRLAMVRVSLFSSKLWILDEPLYGLDKDGIDKFQSMLKTHLKNGGSTLIVSHDESIFKDGLSNESYSEINL